VKIGATTLSAAKSKRFRKLSQSIHQKNFAAAARRAGGKIKKGTKL